MTRQPMFRWHRPACTVGLWVSLILLPTTDVRSQQTGQPPGQPNMLRSVQTPEHISLLDGQNEVLRYNIVAPTAPRDDQSVYQRSGYIHPIRSPRGAIISGDFAPDHPHQHGFFLAWTKTHYRGKPVDFWNQHKGYGIVLHDRVIEVANSTQGDRSVGFRVAVKHCRRDADGTEQKILDDIWSVRLEAANTEDGKPIYRIHFSSRQTNVSDHPLTIDKYHYGGMGLRGRNDWFSKRGAAKLKDYAKQNLPRTIPDWSDVPHRLATDETDDRIAGNHTQPRHVSMIGLVSPTNSKQNWIAGVRVRASSDASIPLPPVRLHPTKPYFSISPCVLSSFDINPGQTYRTDLVMDVFDQVSDSGE